MESKQIIVVAYVVFAEESMELKPSMSVIIVDNGGVGGSSTLLSVSMRVHQSHRKYVGLKFPALRTIYYHNRKVRVRWEI